MAATGTLFSPGTSPFDFSLDSVPAKPVLLPDQLRNCSVALKAFKNKLIKSPQSIHQEFFTIQSNSISDSEMITRCSIASSIVNESKNRYPDVKPFDDNRIKLKRSNEYINASPIKISEGVSEFIATQGPLPHTYEDFWEMVLQYRTPAIVMLTGLIEKGRVKCHDYFHTKNGPKQFGKILLDTKSVKKTDSGLELRSFEVKNNESEEPRLLFCIYRIRDGLIMVFQERRRWFVKSCIECLMYCRDMDRLLCIAVLVLVGLEHIVQYIILFRGS